jgi:diaminopimelate epimerase
MHFAKMHGAGNDYIYVNALAEDVDRFDLNRLARAASDRGFGIGSDGLILIAPSASADFRMRMFNSDGSEAEMCGNGIRCFAKYVYERGLTQSTDLTIETGAGPIRTWLTLDGERVAAVRVDMGRPRLRRADIPMETPGGSPDDRVIDEPLEVGERTLLVSCVSMGNPHCVTFVDDVATYPVTEVGPRVEHHPAFPRRTNVEFVQVMDRTRAKMRVWERGAGETQACGTGACASVVAGHLAGRLGRQVTMELLGGELEIEWADDDHVLMTGPAEEAFRGEFDPEALIAALERRERA